MLLLEVRKKEKLGVHPKLVLRPMLYHIRGGTADRIRTEGDEREPADSINQRPERSGLCKLRPDAQ